MVLNGIEINMGKHYLKIIIIFFLVCRFDNTEISWLQITRRKNKTRWKIISGEEWTNRLLRGLWDVYCLFKHCFIFLIFFCLRIMWVRVIHTLTCGNVLESVLRALIESFYYSSFSFFLLVFLVYIIYIIYNLACDVW